MIAHAGQLLLHSTNVLSWSHQPLHQHLLVTASQEKH
jgi:hypothetical protein